MDAALVRFVNNVKEIANIADVYEVAMSQLQDEVLRQISSTCQESTSELWGGGNGGSGSASTKIINNVFELVARRDASKIFLHEQCKSLRENNTQHLPVIRRCTTFLTDNISSLWQIFLQAGPENEDPVLQYVQKMDNVSLGSENDNVLMAIITYSIASVEENRSELSANSAPKQTDIALRQLWSAISDMNVTPEFVKGKWIAAI